jgi:HAD superfamily hydrolase (TIGR01490 family)
MAAAFFDLDKTVIAKASTLAFGRSLYRAGLISRRTVLRAAYAQAIYLHLGASEERLAKLRESALKLTRGWERDRVRAVVQETLHEVVRPIVYAEALRLITEHREAGRPVVIVSASPEEIVEPLRQEFGADDIIATRPVVDADGRYTGEMGFYAYGTFKVEAMQAYAAERGIDLAQSYAYSDSYTDAPMLEAVGHPVAVNPDRVLLRMAREHDWPVLEFQKPVRVREPGSGPDHGHGPEIAAAGAAAAGAMVAVLSWQLGRRSRRLVSSRGASAPR